MKLPTTTTTLIAALIATGMWALNTQPAQAQPEPTPTAAAAAPMTGGTLTPVAGCRIIDERNGQGFRTDYTGSDRHGYVGLGTAWVFNQTRNGNPTSTLCDIPGDVTGLMLTVTARTTRPVTGPSWVGAGDCEGKPASSILPALTTGWTAGVTLVPVERRPFVHSVAARPDLRSVGFCMFQAGGDAETQVFVDVIGYTR